MAVAGISNVFSKKLTQDEFNTLSQYITSNYGIKMPPEKKTMLQCRLQKRLTDLNIENFKDYIDYVFDGKAGNKEIIHMIDVVTTNKTDFFREPSHFEYLAKQVLPEMEGMRLKIWSAGCSSGEECYTLAIVMEEFLKSYRWFDYQIFGTDISYRVLVKASQAIYSEDKISAIPFELRKRYFLRSKDPQDKHARVIKSLRDKISFRRLNFMDLKYDLNETFDIIFCRNVLIYFDRIIQEKVVRRICNHLRPGGKFFLGHSESIMGMNVPLIQLTPTVYKKI